MVEIVLIALALTIILQRLVELFIAERNRRYLCSLGATEFFSEHYYLFFILHGAWFSGWILEAWQYNILNSLWPLWLALFCSAQILRYWCMYSLGRFWNTRILIMPGQQRIKCGPYRYLNHPNYWAVAIELASIPLIFNAYITAIIATILNAFLLLCIRIPKEEAALKRLN